MNEQIFETGESPHILIRSCAATLDVVGWQRQSVTVEGDGAMVSADFDEIIVDCDSELRIMMPINGRLSINSITPASVTIKHLHGDVQIDSCGALTLNDMGQVQVERVDGALVAENSNGRLHINHAASTVTLRRVESVQINQADGDVSVQFATGFVDLGQIDGRVALNSINGDVILAQASGDSSIENVGGLNVVNTAGRLRLRGTFAHGEQRFSSVGGMVLDWPDAILSPMTLLATAVSIQNDLPFTNAEETQVNGLTQLSGHIEHGKPFLILKTNGSLHLTDSTAPKPIAPPPPEPITPVIPDPRSQATTTPVPNPETRRHILQLLKDDLLSINQAELLLAALNDD